MRKIFYIILVFGIVVFLSNISIAAEHPGEHPSAPAKAEHKEHPDTTQTSEHPAHGIAPGEALKEHPGAEHPGAVLSAADVIKGIKLHISGVTKANNGVFAIRDEKEGKDLRLKLVKVHEDKVSYIKKDGAYFACTDFITKDGKAMYDLDFWMKKSDKGGLEVYQTKIHKKDGNPRFTYKDDEIAPVE